MDAPADLAAALQAAGAKHGAVITSGGATADGGASVWGMMPPRGVVEAGSVTKGLVGLLLAASTEASPQSRLGDHLELRGPAAEVTLGSLATHTSGLPRLPPGSALRLLTHPSDPYRGLDLRGLLRAAGRAPVRPTEAAQYSNLGVALLGHALAAAAGTTFWELATSRVLEPLGMASSGNVRLTFSNGRPWRVDAMAPAGGLRASVEDLLLLASALHGPSPLAAAVAEALAPRAVAGRGQVGWCWMLAERPAGTVAWHNGGTGSAWAFVGARAGLAVAAVVGGKPQNAWDAIMLDHLGGAAA